MKSIYRKRTGIMLAQPLEENRLAKWKPPFIVQPKLDGERCRATWQVENTLLPKPVLFTSEENIFNTVPHIREAITLLNRPDLELDGELYIPNSNFSAIHSRSSSSRLELHEDYQSLQYHVFDICDETLNQVERLHLLNSLNLRPPLFIVPSIVVDSLEEILEWMEKFVDQGYEGIIVREIDNFYVRKRSLGMMKFKPKCEDTYEIVGYKEEKSIEGNAKGTLGALICKGSDGNIFSVGSGLTDFLSQEWWDKQDELIGKKCRVQYQHLTPGKKVPRFPVFISIEP
jgi:DNA ligase 1